MNTPNSKNIMDHLSKFIINPENLTSEETRKLIHNLQIHLFDLEQKNEQSFSFCQRIKKFYNNYSELYHFVPVGYFIIDKDGLIQDINLAGAAVLGSEPGFLINTPFIRYIFWKDRSTYAQHINQLQQSLSPQACEIRIMRPDGSRSYAQLESIAIKDHDGGFKYCRTVICTEHRRDEDSLEKIRRTYSIINKSRLILLNADNESELLDQICQVIVDLGRYRMAKIVFINYSDNTLSIVAGWGDSKDEIRKISINENCCPVSEAIKTNSTIILRNILTSPAYSSCRSHAILNGYAASITLPLSAKNQIIGVLNIYANEPDSFGTEEVNLLEVFAENLSHGISLLREKIKRKKAEQDLAKYHSRLEDMVWERTSKLRKALKEKEILLREIHHRVKNNMQVISSLIAIQEDQITDLQIKKIFQESQTRIMVMALIHENLYLSESLEEVDLNNYITGLALALLQTYGAGKKIELKTDIQDIFLGIDHAVPCGLIINELISNSLKYAFSDNQKGIITIAAYINKDIIELSVKDNGCGLPDDNVSLNTGNTLGFKLIQGLVENQLRGTIKLQNDKGTCFTIFFQTKNQKRN